MQDFFSKHLKLDIIDNECCIGIKAKATCSAATTIQIVCECMYLAAPYTLIHTVRQEHMMLDQLRGEEVEYLESLDRRK
jgi:hypothetical protein